MSATGSLQDDQNDAGFAGRIAMLYALGRHYLSLPFAVLCVPAAFIGGGKFALLPLVPLTLQLVGVIAAERLTSAYKAHGSEHDAHYWARRYTFVSAIAGATWGVGVPFWFVWNSFPAQAYLALALLGMTSTEFIARSAHRPAYLAHTCFSLGPLVALLLWQGGLYPIMTAILVVLFAAVLISYCNGIGKLLSESTYLRNENTMLVQSLSREKAEAIAARDAAQAGAQAKAAFIANISHELRTPMISLLGMAQLLERADLSKQQRDHVTVMLDAGRGLQTMLDDVIALTRDSSRAHEDEDCDPIHSVRAITRLLQPRAWEKGLRLSMSTAPTLPHVALDPKRVRQVLLKLTENALKFTEKGGVEIRVNGETTPDGHIQVRFRVCDSGHGVAPNIAAHLFKPFAIGDESYARKEQGAGLGLAVARRIVEQAGGSIGFESALNSGSTFWFTLPATAAGAALARPILDMAASTPPSHLTVLIFTRTPDAHEHLTDLLEPFGNRLACVQDQAEAMTRAGREHFDAIIADAADADRIAAGPGVRAPVIALALHGERAPDCAADILRSPLSAEALYDALRKIEPQARDAEDGQNNENAMLASIDPVAFTTLEQSVGLPTLIEILQCYIGTAEELTAALAEACAAENWSEAAKLAQDIVGAAGGLGLLAITQAARAFAQKTREGGDSHTLRNAAQAVVGEHLRARKALSHLYPGLAA